MHQSIIAVDFDGTLCKDEYPQIGEPIPPVIDYIKRLRAAGNIIILWTCRSGQKLTDAVTWCKQQGLIFDYVNENAQANVKQYGGDTRKIFADVYIDDKTVLPQQIIIKESIEMKNKANTTTQDIASAVLADVDNLIAEKFCGDTYFTLRGVLNDVGDKYGVCRRSTLGDLSWAEIADIAKAGQAKAHFRVGDEKEIELITGEKITAVILDFNHDALDDTSATDVANITFGIKGVLDGWYEMNEEYTNEGGWKESKMRTVYMARIERLLPADIRDALKTVLKATGTGGGSNNVEITADKLFLLSEVEVAGSADYSADGEGNQYEYYKDENNRVKMRDGSAYNWWLRSPNATGSTGFRHVSATGNVNNASADNTRGASFGFCL